MLPYQNPPFGPMQMTMDSFVQQASTYMDPNQLATMFPYLFTPIQHGMYTGKILYSIALYCALVGRCSYQHVFDYSLSPLIVLYCNYIISS